jgi:hypothetical protein
MIRLGVFAPAAASACFPVDFVIMVKFIDRFCYGGSGHAANAAYQTDAPASIRHCFVRQI